MFSIQLSEQQMFFVFFFMCLLYNLIIHKNLVLLTLCVVVFFFGLRNQNLLTSSNNKRISKKTVLNLIERFENNHYTNPTNNVLLNTLPKSFRYLFVKPVFLQPLYELRFIRQYGNESFIQIFVILERFLKIFYNILSKRYDVKYNIDHLKDLHGDMKVVKNNIMISIPKYSSNIHRFGDTSLISVVDKNFDIILLQMRKKIDIILSLINEKNLHL